MLDSNVKQLLNEQVNKEVYSAYLYLDFSNFYKSKGLDGFANWYNVQAQEERDHALLFMQYLQNNNVRVTLDAIAKPNVPMDTLMDPLKAGLEHEEYVTSLIHALYAAGQLSFAGAVAGLSTSAGVGLAVLFRANKSVKHNVFIVGLLYVLGVCAGMVAGLFG